MERDVLLIAHSDWRQGRLGPLLTAKGYRVTWCSPALGECLPPRHDGYAATILLGGAMSANDSESQPYLRREIDWIELHIAGGHPFLGICLGAELLARALGAGVAPHPEGLQEIGYYPIHPTAAGEGLIPTDLQVYHWHREGFDLPRGTELLARGDLFPHQAYRLGSKI